MLLHVASCCFSVRDTLRVPRAIVQAAAFRAAFPLRRLIVYEDVCPLRKTATQARTRRCMQLHNLIDHSPGMIKKCLIPAAELPIINLSSNSR
jgi:hypothetical protein